ncbi:M23 family metallopeptidase [Antrihabitans stalactiti]
MPAGRHVSIEGHGLLGRTRVMLVVIAAAAVLAASDTSHIRTGPATATVPGVAPAAFARSADVEPLDLDHDLQVHIQPRSNHSYLKQIDKGERMREQKVVEAAARATLARAKAEAAAAIAGEWQPWLAGAGANGTLAGIGGYSLPAKGAFTSGFGQRWGVLHAGIDIAGPIGTPIYAVSSGTVIDAGPASGFGLWVRIKHDDGAITVYGHLYDFFVSVGERVPAGLQIARMGNRGDSTGPHLHFEVILAGQHVDPQSWLALHGIQVG